MEKTCPRCGAPAFEQRQMFLRTVYRWYECDEHPEHFRFPENIRGYTSDEEMAKKWAEAEKEGFITMNQRAQDLRTKISMLENSLERHKHELTRLELDCQHVWSDPEYVPEHQEGYYIPPDGKGSDWRPGCHVEPRTIKRWRRTCKVCGRVELTTSTRKQKQAGRIPGTSAEVDVPYFSPVQIH